MLLSIKLNQDIEKKEFAVALKTPQNVTLKTKLIELSVSDNNLHFAQSFQPQQYSKTENGS